MPESINPALPAALRQRLDAAGVTDAASLERALEADESLRAEVEAFAAAQAAQQIEQLLSEFLAVASSNELIEFWNRVPPALEQPFLAAAEAQLAQAEQDGRQNLAEALRARLSDLRQWLEEQQAVEAQFKQALAALADVPDEQLAELWQGIPLDLEDTFLAVAEAHATAAEQAGADDQAARLRERLSTLRELQQAQRDFRAMSPTERAVLAFWQTESDDAARMLFAEQRALLQPYDAQRMLDQLGQQAAPELHQRFAARAELLRSLRGAAPQQRTADTPAAQEPQPTFDNRQLAIGGNLSQAGGNIYINSAHVEGGGSAITINNIQIERCWVRPTAPPLEDEQLIERAADMQAVAALLDRQGSASITGKSTTSALHGMPGIGKTILARQLALALETHYPGGVIVQKIGPDLTSRDQAQPILNRWANYALAIPPELGAQFDPDAVRALLGGHGRQLVVLDDVWSADIIRPLREALPPGTHLLVTTRLQTVVQALGVPEYRLDTLDLAEARALTALRLGWGAAIPPEHLTWCDALIAGVGRHVLALDVALRPLRVEHSTPADWQRAAERMVAHIQTGRGFEQLAMPEGAREQNVELVLSYSYARLDPALQRMFRLLGVFALEAAFDTAAAAQLAEAEPEEARQRLSRLANLALLGRAEAGRWQQHALLRGYALALLQRAGEHEPAAARHAAIYADAMRAADDAQQAWRMRPELPQLRRAFAWAIENDLARAQDLIGQCANLQAAFGGDQEQRHWCEQALAVAKARGRPAEQARAYGSLGNALQRVATLAGEDRRARLLAALAAYDEALRFRTPDSAPLDYAMTQNNRANLLSDLATLAGEDRRARLLDALDAYDEALRFYTPDTAPLAYAMTQNNRATLLSDLATLAGEDRRARLLDALDAYDEALRFRTPDTAPLDYAATQNNRANLLSDLATLPGEDRRARLLQALAAAQEALEFFALLQHEQYYQTCQRTLRGLRAACAGDFAALWATLNIGPPPDWLLEADPEIVALLERFGPLLRAVAAEARDQTEARHELEATLVQLEQNGWRISTAARAIWAGERDPAVLIANIDSNSAVLVRRILELIEQPDPPDPAQAADAEPALPAELRARLAAAGVTDEASLQAALERDPQLKQEYLAAANAWLAQQTQRGLELAWQAFVQVGSFEQLVQFWQQLPEALQAPFLQLVEAEIAVRERQGEDEAAQALRERLDGLRQIQAASTPEQQAFQQALDGYLALRQAAEADAKSVRAWQAAIAAGEALLAPEFVALETVNWPALHANLAGTYTSLCIAYEDGDARDLAASLAATERAIALQPGEPMWQRNRAGTLIDLGRLDEAASAIALARSMQPDAPRLADLDAALDQARAGAEVPGVADADERG